MAEVSLSVCKEDITSESYDQEEQSSTNHQHSSPSINNTIQLSNNLPTHTISTSCSTTESQITYESATIRQNGTPSCADKADTEMEVASTRERKRSRDVGDLEMMDHSGLQQAGSKKAKTMFKDGVMLCYPLSYDSVKEKPPDKVTRELARCLHEPKLVLLGEVVRVLGVERTLEIFQETAVIQETGGTLIADKTKKKTPGGVFFTLVKQRTTEDEKKDIFQKDKEIANNRKKMARKQKYIKEREHRAKERERRNAKQQLQVFQSQLGVPTNTTGGVITEWNCSLPSLPQVSKNIHKRLGKPASHDQQEQLGNNSLKQEMKSGQLQEEKEAAEEFEQMNEYQVDFGID